MSNNRPVAVRGDVQVGSVYGTTEAFFSVHGVQPGHRLRAYHVGRSRPRLGCYSGHTSGTVRVAFHTYSKEIMDSAQDGTPGLPYHGQMFDWFIGATPEGKLTTDYGALERYESNADASVWTFVLRKGIKWHDGTEMTGMTSSSASTLCRSDHTMHAMWRGTYQSRPHGSRRSDDRTDASQTRRCRYSRCVWAAGGQFFSAPQALYREDRAQWVRGETPGQRSMEVRQARDRPVHRVRANTAYWNRERIPGFAKLHMLLVPESRTRVAMLKRAEAELISLEPQDVEPLKKDGYKIIGPRDTGFPMLSFYRTYDPAFLTHKLEFRKALILGVDWDAVVKAFIRPRWLSGARWCAAASRVTLGYDPELPPYPYAPEDAKRLLKASGYKGEKVTYWNFFCNCSTPSENLLTSIL